MKLWPKAKTWDREPPKGWSSIPWRAIASYSRHHHRDALGIVFFCTAAVRTLGWGWTVESPKAVMEAVHSFNNETSPSAWLSREEEVDRLPPSTWEERTLDYGLYDLKDTFVNISLEEMRESLERVKDALLVKDPTTRFF